MKKAKKSAGKMASKPSGASSNIASRSNIKSSVPGVVGPDRQAKVRRQKAKLKYHSTFAFCLLTCLAPGSDLLVNNKLLAILCHRTAMQNRLTIRIWWHL